MPEDISLKAILTGRSREHAAFPVLVRSLTSLLPLITFYQIQRQVSIKYHVTTIVAKEKVRTTFLKVVCGGVQGRYRGITLTLYTAKRLGLIVLPYFLFTRVTVPCQQDFFSPSCPYPLTGGTALT